ncbi:hypothetical protein BC834DRAFT_452704 [Gloeopeniophorella convolvens]|nr:hypothetical protein BC834DRAFT_452704 [Gloeopeniophorella convolvens]
MDTSNTERAEWAAGGAGSHLDGYFTPHLLRHVSRIQIRNFTPFPARDAFASALTQPSEQSQFTEFGRFSDDLDVTLTRKRARKISSTSIATLKSQGADGQASDDSWAVGSASSGDLRGRKRTMSRASARELGQAASSGSHPPPSGTGAYFRPNRPRTLSISSSVSGKGTAAMDGLWQTHTQKMLEKVLQSRLVETFITVTITSPTRGHSSSEDSATPASPPTSPPLSPPASHSRRPSSRESPTPKRKVQPAQSSPSRSASKAKEEQPSKRTSRTSTVTFSGTHTSSLPSHRKTGSGTVKSNGDPSPKPHSLTSRSRTDPESRTVPNFISGIHGPSTNPNFSLDLASGNDFSKWTDPSATHLTVHLWAKLHPDSPSSTARDKGKRRQSHEPDISDPQWTVVEKWDVCLSDLVPLDDEVVAQPSRLPSNTLLFTLSPPDKTFYLPTTPSLAPTRPPSPSGGYSSDPEVRMAGDLFTSRSATPRRKDFALPRIKSRQPRVNYARSSSSWQDLVKLVNLQCAIVDTQQSLFKVIRNVDVLFTASNVNDMARARETSEREAHIADWRDAQAQVRAESDDITERIRKRREEIRKRRETLSLATTMHGQDVAEEAITIQELSRERDSAAALQRRISPIRVTLISTLASLFPIELMSGSDLLFSILNVPLPIPLGTTDPAPPLSLPAHKEVTEDSVASALGYAALVVQLLAMYLGKMLVYPITFCGSKSMIRDGISAMVGPRMFPLFSKNVDTYRFEYGVFLLNKDLEMLMSDRNLRALDMRHTLPNLKNLLLTLSDGEGAQLTSLRSPTSSLSGLESPARPSSPLKLSPSADSVSTSNGLSEDDTDSPPHSGSTTPSKASTDSNHGSLSRMSRPFFGLSGFLRSRYPSSSQRPSVRVVPEAPENLVENEDGTDDGQEAPGSAEERNSDDEDRRTLRGVPVGDGEEEDTKDGVLPGDGHAGSVEKGTETPGSEGSGPLISQMVTNI